MGELVGINMLIWYMSKLVDGYMGGHLYNSVYRPPVAEAQPVLPLFCFRTSSPANLLGDLGNPPTQAPHALRRVMFEHPSPSHSLSLIPSSSRKPALPHLAPRERSPPCHLRFHQGLGDDRSDNYSQQGCGTLKVRHCSQYFTDKRPRKPHDRPQAGILSTALGSG